MSCFVVGEVRIGFLAKEKGQENREYVESLIFVLGQVRSVDLKWRINQAVRTKAHRFQAAGLNLVVEKSEAITFMLKYKMESVRITLRGKVINLSYSTKYLGFILDRNGNFKEHLGMMAKKADTIMIALGRIMQNVQFTRYFFMERQSEHQQSTGCLDIWERLEESSGRRLCDVWQYIVQSHTRLLIFWPVFRSSSFQYRKDPKCTGKRRTQSLEYGKKKKKFLI